MKTTILNKEINEDIDWSKSQWVVAENNQIIFTNGKHDELTFEGNRLPKFRDSGEFSKIWGKNFFKPIPKEGLTIHIQND
jgi:hypothetical protein